MNRLKVDPGTFQYYARGRMQRYNSSNLRLADSLYLLGAARENF